MRRKKKPVMLIVFAAVIVLSLLIYFFRYELYFAFTSKGINEKGGDITIVNAIIWTGDSTDLWKTSMTIKDGKIIEMNADKPEGKVIDAQGKLIVPGFWDAHCHPHSPFILTSPEAPTLFGAKTVKEVLDRLDKYVKEHPEDKFPRLFGWMSDIFKEGEKPTRQMIDAVVSDRPVCLVHHGGHSHWVNTKALEMTGALEKDPPDMKGDGVIHRDPNTGLATGYLQETEYAATSGLMINLVKKIKPFSFEEQVIIQQLILEEYPKVGVTSIWTKCGDLENTKIYEQILKNNSLPVRVCSDNMFTYYADISDIQKIHEYGKKLEESDLPKNFLRGGLLKVYIDLPVVGWKWMFEPYDDDSTNRGKPAWETEYFKQQLYEADKLGMQINVSVYGDRGVHEILNLFEEMIKNNPPRDRRHLLEHAEFIKDSDVPRFRQLGVIASFNPIISYPDEGFQKNLVKSFGIKRLSETFNRYDKLIASGAVVLSGSDFPLAPVDPLIGIHILVNGTDINGKEGLFQHTPITIEQALYTYTVNPAYANFAENRLGKLKTGYDADFVILSENILSPDFNKERLVKVKVNLTVFNGHIIYEDFSSKEKVIDFTK
ncbi:MAG: amidohydrolase [Ignavibacteria bacterium]|nr:amidohydrolase [Ignavibacteria bacterium]